MSAQFDETLAPTHVVFLLHGLWGWREHMYALRDALQEQAKRQEVPVDIYCCRSYEGTKTYDGVDVCADRAVAEIRQHIAHIQRSGRKVDRFSILGYSLGGLVARMAVYQLNSESFFNEVQACNFTTFASPAIGLPKTPGRISDMIQAASAFFLSRTGTHLYLRDRRKDSRRPLVYDLATYKYASAVAIFRNVDVYANSVGDRVVPYLTGGIIPSDPFMPALAQARRGRFFENSEVLSIDKLELTFDRAHAAVITDVRPVTSSSLPTQEKSSPTPVTSPPGHSLVTTPSKPSVLSTIRPWFDPATYPFLPPPLNYVLVALIPLVVPAVILVIGTFSIQRVASAIRVRRHLRARSETSETPNALVVPQPLDTSVEDLPSSRDLESQTDDAETHMLPPVETSPASPSAEAAVATSVTVDLSGVYSDARVSSSNILPQLQKDMIRMLDESLHMRKHLAFLPNVFTSHPAIICQDRKNPEHLTGLSVVEHWADNFVF